MYDVWSQDFGILARFLGDQPAVVVAVEQLEVPLLRLDRLQRCLGYALRKFSRRAVGAREIARIVHLIDTVRVTTGAEMQRVRLKGPHCWDSVSEQPLGRPHAWTAEAAERQDINIIAIDIARASHRSPVQGSPLAVNVAESPRRLLLCFGVHASGLAIQRQKCGSYLRAGSRVPALRKLPRPFSCQTHTKLAQGQTNENSFET